MVSIATQTDADISQLYRFRDEARETCSSHAVMMEMMDRIQSLEKELENAKIEISGLKDNPVWKKCEEYDELAEVYCGDSLEDMGPRMLWSWCEEMEDSKNDLEEMDEDFENAKNERDNLVEAFEELIEVWGKGIDFDLEDLAGGDFTEFTTRLREREEIFEANHESGLIKKIVGMDVKKSWR